MNNTIRTLNTLKRQSREDYDRELAERAARADAIIAATCIAGLVVLSIVQIMEKVPA